MKKLLSTLLVILAVNLFSVEWYSTRSDIVNDAVKAQRDSKDTLWYGYYQGSSYVYGMQAERAVYVNVNDFGLEYPIKLFAVDAFLYDPGYEYKYKVYNKTGDLMWEMTEAGVSTTDYFNVHQFDTPMIMRDDFWISVVPLGANGYPRLISSDDTSSDHSYYSDGTGWAHLEISEGVYREWNIDFSLSSPFDGEDIYAPTLRSIDGTVSFMNMDMNLKVMVQDQSAVVSPTLGQYSLDGGTSWTDFQLTYTGDATKGSYYFEGTIPGQPEGTEGLVKVYLEDVLGYNAWSEEHDISWTKYVPWSHESFEGEFPPAGWSLNSVGAGFVKALEVNGAPVHTGFACAAHMDDAGEQDDWLWTPEVTLPANGIGVFSFWQFGEWISYYVFHQVVVSTDGGATYTQLYSEAPPAGPDGDFGLWDYQEFVLKDYAGMDVMFGFNYQGDYTDIWYIDDVSVLYDPDPPVPVTLEGDPDVLYSNGVIGAYLNNDMKLDLTLTDQSGVASVTGHYSFDGGVTVTDISLIQTDTDVWSCSIPASSVELNGTIYFTCTDIGDNSMQTTPYEIYFVKDEIPPIPISFDYGAPVFINEDMILTITFTEASEISSVRGFYSEDNFATHTEITMTPAKLHTYIYTGVIPAKTEATSGRVVFVITDSEGNMSETPLPGYNVEWLSGEIVFFDDFESGQSEFWDWTTPETTWAIVDTESVSPTHSLTDSPGGNYPDNTENRLMSKPMDFSAYLSATAYFWAKIDVEPDWEYFRVQGTTSTDAVPADGEWTTLLELDGYNQPWKKYQVDLSSFAGYANVRLRLTLDSDNAVNADGVYIDDFKIPGYTDDNNGPYIYWEGPDKITAESYTIPREFTIPVGTGDFLFYPTVSDPSGISEVKAIYTVDGGPEEEFIPEVSSGPSGVYELMIPEQEAGSQVHLRISAKDASEYFNESITKTWMIRFGNFLYYQNGDDFTDYLDIIGTSPDANAQAVSKRITMGPMGSKTLYRSNLVGITIDNYIYIPDWPSDPMYIHVWADDNGQPGADLITPIYHELGCTPESNYELTYVDLRGYPELQGIEGDVFVGYTTAGTQTLILYEVVGTRPETVPGYVAFERSWLGFDTDSDGTVDSWTHDPANVYHISAVIDYYEEVGINPDQITPLKTALYQNYPNPFNPVTQVKYALAKTADVKLNVYNVAGQLVSELVKGVMDAGYHAADFDGSNLNSGVYYYTLEVDGKAVTKRMVLIK